MISHEIKYAKSGNLNIAYQVVGRGKEYLILIPGWVSNIEELWNFPGFTEFIQAIASVRKVVLFDKRGTGLSDRVSEEDMPNLAVRIDDLRAIMDQEGIRKASVMGVSEGGPMAILFSVTFPERVSSLIIIGGYSNWLRSSRNPHGVPMETHEKILSKIDDYWASGFGLKGFAPSWHGKAQYDKIWASFLRKSASPNTAKTLYKMNLTIDVTPVLKEIRQPCLIIHRKDDKVIPIGLGRELAANIPNAKLLELDGADHFFWIDADGTIKKEIVEFLGHAIPVSHPTTAIYTVLLVSPADKKIPSSISLFEISNYFVEVIHRDECTLISFRSPSQALRIAKDIYSLANFQTKVMIHTGVVNLGLNVISGPAVDVLREANSKIDQAGIWVSQVSQQFLTGPQINWPTIKNILSQFPSYSFNWYLLGSGTKRDRLESFFSYQDDKIDLTDIEALLSLKDYLDARFLDNPSLEDLSYYSGLNNFKLKYGFKKLFQVPVKKYLKDLRLEFSRQLLKETDLPIQQVARKIAYEQPASFSRAYQEKFGISPQEEKKHVSALTE